MNTNQAGFFVSAAFHLGLLGTLYIHGMFDSYINPPADALAISLDNFTSASRPDPESPVTPPQHSQQLNPTEEKTHPQLYNNDNKPQTEPVPTRQQNHEPDSNSELLPQANLTSIKRSDTEHPQPEAESLDTDNGLIYSEEKQYTDALKKAIEERKFYPSRARRSAHEGNVVVGFTLSRNGDINQIHVIQSSSVRILDKAAINAVRSIGRFQPIPQTIDREWWEIEISLTYKLI